MRLGRGAWVVLLALAFFVPGKSFGQNYVARVSNDDTHNYPESSWQYYENLAMAFYYADNIGGPAIIEILADCSIDEAFTFDATNVYLTIRKAESLSNSPTVTKAHANGPMVTFAPQNGNLTVQNIIFNGGGETNSSHTNGGIFKILKPEAYFFHCSFNDCYVSDTATHSQYGQNPVVTNNPYPNGGYQALSNGGAIAHYYEGNDMSPTAGSLRLYGCSFSNCQALAGNVANSSQGGAVYFCWKNSGSALTFDGQDGALTVFNGCYAKRGGGAVWVEGAYGTVSFEYSSFISCTAGGNGGALLSDTPNTELVNTGFNSCSARQGGAVYFNATPTVARPQTLSDCHFSGCSATSGGGGAVYFSKTADSGAQTILNCTFDGCTATSNGGAVYTAGGLEVDNNNYSGPRFISCSATNNSAHGGAIFSAGTLTVKNIKFHSCTAHGGGAIWAAKATVLENTIFGDKDDDTKGCQSLSGGSDLQGGAVNVRDGGLTLKNTTAGEEIGFYYCSSASDGGAIYVNNDGMSVINNTQSNTIAFEHCKCLNTNNGGAICLNDEAFSADNNAGSLLFYDCGIDGTATNNSSYYGGGAIAVLNNSRGFVTFDGNSGLIQFQDCYAEGAYSGRGSGAIYAAAGLSMIGNSNDIKFLHCYATQGGGGVLYVANGTLSLKADTSTPGTILFSFDEHFDGTEVTYVGYCYSGGSGGAIYHAGTGLLTIDHVTFQDSYANTSSGSGGVVYTKSSNATVSDCGFFVTLGTPTTAKYGGAIYHDNTGTLNLVNTTINGFLCTASGGQGGAVYSKGGTLNLSGTTIQNCGAASLGGAIYSDANTVNINNSLTVSGNTLTNATIGNAAGIYLTKERVIVNVTCDNSSNTANLYIYDNKTSDDAQSNLKMGYVSPGFLIKGTNLTSLTGKVGIVNATSTDRWFGESSNSSVCGADAGNYFKDDQGNYVAKYEGEPMKRIVWELVGGGTPVCKITDANGTQLYYKFNDSEIGIAQFNNLADAFGAFGDPLRTDVFFTDAAGTTAATPHNIEMLVTSYEQKLIITVPGNPLVLKTDLSTTAGDTCKITRSGFFGSMYVMDDGDNFTLTNITIDGAGGINGLGGNKTCDQTGGIVRTSGNSALTLDAGCVLQNSKNMYNGGAVYMGNGGSFTMRNGAVIQYCQCVTATSSNTVGNGSAVYMDNNTTLLMQGSTIRHCTMEGNNGGHATVYLNGVANNSMVATIEDCTFEDCNVRNYGGAVYCNAATLNITGTLFKSCSAGTGGVIYTDNYCMNPTINNCTFKDFKASSSGGAIYFNNNNNGTLNITDSSFDRIGNDDLAAPYGGAIYFYGNSTLNVTRCTFKHLTAKHYGGAICANPGTTVNLVGDGSDVPMFEDCIVSSSGTTSNSRNRYGGGAVCCYYSSNGVATSLTMKDLQIKDCQAIGDTYNFEGRGGGISLTYYATAVLDNVNITGCRANLGAAIFTDNPNANSLVLKNGTSITGNKLHNGSGTRTHAAGVYCERITFGDAEATTADAVTINNNTTWNGEPSNLRLAGATNSVSVLSELSGEIHVINPRLKGQQFGSENAASGYDYNVRNVFVSDFPYRWAYRDNNNGLYWDADNVCKITDAAGNTLQVDGNPALYSALTTAFSAFADKTFTGGTPVNIEMLVPEYHLESGITVSKANIDVTLKTDLTATNNTRCTIYRGNTARDGSNGDGSMFNVSGTTATLRLNDIVLDGQRNKSQFKTGSGCGIWLAAGAKLYMHKIENGNMVDGHATVQNCWVNGSGSDNRRGGGVFLNGELNSYDMSYWHLKDCYAPYLGGGVYTKTENLTVNHSTFEGCSAVAGLYCLKKTTGTLSLIGCEFKNCSNNSSDGGGVYSDHGTVVIEQSTFENCIANSSYGNGGGIYINNSTATSSLTLTGAVFDHCRANGQGGGVYSSAHDITAVGCTFSHCNAENKGEYWFYGGGALMQGSNSNTSGTTLLLTNCTFTGNSAKVGGGGSVNSVASTITIEGCDFNGKGAVDPDGNHRDDNAARGGAIWTRSSNKLTIRDWQYDNGGETVTKRTTIKNCSVSDYGGAIYADRSLSITGTTIDTCSAGYGGGVYFWPRSNYSLTLSDTDTIRGCSAGGNGGGICFGSEQGMTYNNQTLTGAYFVGCSATGSGGGIHAYTYMKNTTLNDMTFEDCSAYLSGGGAYLNNYDCSSESLTLLTNVQFKGCSAGSAGGGLYLYYMQKQIVNNQQMPVITLSRVNVDGCSAGSNGGGIAVSGRSSPWVVFHLNDCQIVNNTVGNSSGGVNCDTYLQVSGLVKIDGNTKTTAKDDGTPNNVALGSAPIYIVGDGLECGSHIGVTCQDIGNSRDIASGTEPNCLNAFRNHFFFEDSGSYLPFCFNYTVGSTNCTTKKIYLIKSWNNLADASGISESDGVVTVNTEAGLAYIAKQVNEGNTYEGKTIKLAADLKLASTSSNDGKLWIPIGFAADVCGTSAPFLGMFDGQGHTITGLNSYLPHKAMGLFGSVGIGGEVKNVYIENGTLEYTYIPDTVETTCMGALVGELDGGTVAYSENAAALTSSAIVGVIMGGLVGTVANNGTVHSSMAMSNMTGNNGTMGGLVGNLASGTVANSFANALFTVSGDTPAIGGLVGTNNGIVDNCYVRLRGTAPASGFGWMAGTGSGTVTNCYIPDGNSATGCDTYMPTALVSGKYGFAHSDQQVGSSTLVAKLNERANGDYAQWTRTMGSSINGDYPVLLFGNAICLGSKANSAFIGYGSDLNAMIAAYNSNNSNGGGNIYLYDVPSEVTTNTSSNVRVYIDEDLGILQGDENSLRARAGVTIKNASGNAKEGASASWHMFSSAISNAPLGIEYHTQEVGYEGVADYAIGQSYSSLAATGIDDGDFGDRSYMDPPKTTFWQTDDPSGESYYNGTGTNKIGYFPTNTPYGTWRNQSATTGFFDLYTYSEENYHWMNLKREGTATLSDHWHTDRDDSGNHQKISYTNGTTMPAGKGYLLALSNESMLMADGVLNNGTKTVTVTKSEPSANVPSSSYTPDESKFRSINLVGNPYQSYLDFDAFATENTMLENMYATRSGGEYIYYTADASANGEYTASQYVHPHQGFFVRVSDEQATGSYTVTFGNTMRLAGTSEQYSSPYRGQVNYPLVNLLCFDAEGHRDLTTVEVNRPEQGGGHKMEGLRTAEGTLAAQLGTELFQTAFVPEGVNEVPVRFEAYADGQYTIRWNTLHGEFRYLHLIDNMTGADVDCLTAEEYTFNGKTTDYTSRFKLVFDASEDEDGASTGSATFAYYANGEIVITADACDASLQVIDMLGRVLRSEAVNGNARINVNAAPGVYVLRLISGENVKTQKIVVR